MKVLVIGCGIVGAAIAYHLADLKLEVEVWEQNSSFGFGASGKALGVLMAVCSLKSSGALLDMRLASIALYDRWLPLLQATSQSQLVLSQGILCIPRTTDRLKWEKLCATRANQGYILQWRSHEDLASLGLEHRDFGVFSPADRVVHPQNLLQALVESAQGKGVKFCWGRKAELGAEFPADRVVIAGGLGSEQLANIPLKAVGGQGIKVHLPSLNQDLTALHLVDDQGDINIVPLGNENYWIGATVEFEPHTLPRTENVNLLLDRASAYFPEFEHSIVLDTWAGYRPRPIDRGAPVIDFVPDRDNWIVASGHYRNGMLLAPVTAKIVGDLILLSQ